MNLHQERERERPLVTASLIMAPQTMAQQKHGFPRAAQKEGILLDKQIFNNIIQPYDQKLKSTRLHSGSLLSRSEEHTSELQSQR